MRFHLIIALAIAGLAVSYCHCQDAEDDLPGDFIFALSPADVEDEYIIETFKNVSKTLKHRISALVDKAIETTSELRRVAGEKGKELKKHLKELWRELRRSRDQLKGKLREIFSPSQYSEEGKLRDFEPIRVKLYHVLGKVNEQSDLEMLRDILRDLYDEITAKVFQYSRSHPAQYSEDVETVYMIKTLKELYVTVKDKVGVIFDKIKVAAGKLKRTLGDGAAEIKEELKILREKLRAARKDVKDKVKEVFQPSQYSTGNLVQETLRPLREKLEKFIKDTEEVSEENVDELRKVLRELLSEIKHVSRALRRKKPAIYSAVDAAQDIQAYVQAADALYKELQELIEGFEKLMSEENLNMELVEKYVQQIRELEEKVKALQEQVQQPSKYFLKPLLEKAKKVLDIASVKLLDFAMKVFRAGQIVKEAAGRASEHVKHSFGKIKEIVTRGRDEMHQQIKDALGQEGTTTVSSATADIQETSSITPVSQTTSDVTESRTAALETSTTTDFVGFGDPEVQEES